MNTPLHSPLMLPRPLAPAPEFNPISADIPRPPSLVQRLLVWVAVVLAAAAFYPLLAQQLQTLWFSREYQHAPLVLAAIALLVWVRWPDKSELRAESVPSPMGLLAGLIGLAAAIVLDSPPVAMLSAIPAAFSSLRCLSGAVGHRRFLGPCLLLLLLVPLPYFLQMELVQLLKSWTTQAASRMLDLAGIDHQLLGFTIAVPGRWFFVDDACSGVNSLFGMIALALVLAVWSRLPFLVAISMIPAAVLGVLCVNILRMVIIVGAQVWQGIDLASGTPHQMLGLALLPLTLLLVVGLVSWTQWLLAPIGTFGDSPLTTLWDRVLHGGQLHDDEQDFDPLTPAPAPALLTGMFPEEAPASSWSGWSWTPILGLAGAAIYGQFYLHGLHAAADRSSLPMTVLTAHSLPETFFNWKQTDFREIERRHRDPQGSHSRLWHYQHTEMDRRLVLAVDYPFPGWHELPACYRATGWTVQERKVSGGQGRPFVVRVTMVDGTGATGWLWFSLVDAGGKTLEPPQKHWSATLFNQMRIALSQFGADTSTRQVQMLVPAGRGLSADELLQLEQKFRELIPKLAPKLVEEARGTSPVGGEAS